MPEPVDFRILQILQGAFQGLDVRTGAYATVNATAVKLDPDIDVETLLGSQAVRPFVLLEQLPDAPDDECEKGNIGITLNFRAHYVADSDATDDASRARTYARANADIERAVAGVFFATPSPLGMLSRSIKVVRRAYDTVQNGAQIWTLNDLAVRVERDYGQPDTEL
jgi:hypothetical protein